MPDRQRFILVSWVVFGGWATYGLVWAYLKFLGVVE